MIILASQSPRRREILEKLIPNFIVCPSDASEQIDERDPRAYAMELAVRKAQDVASNHPGDTVIAADTIVCLGDRILGKPGDKREAHDYLRTLSGEVHEVYTGVAVVHA